MEAIMGATAAAVIMGTAVLQTAFQKGPPVAEEQLDRDGPTPEDSETTVVSRAHQADNPTKEGEAEEGAIGDSLEIPVMGVNQIEVTEEIVDSPMIGDLEEVVVREVAEDSLVTVDSQIAEDSAMASRMIEGSEETGDSQVTEDSEETEDSQVTEDSVEVGDSQVTEDSEETGDSQVTEDSEETGDSQVTEDSVETVDIQVTEDSVEVGDRPVAEDLVETGDSQVTEGSEETRDSEVAVGSLVIEAALLATGVSGEMEALVEIVEVGDSLVIEAGGAEEAWTLGEEEVVRALSVAIRDHKHPRESVLNCHPFAGWITSKVLCPRKSLNFVPKVFARSAT